LFDWKKIWNKLQMPITYGFLGIGVAMGILSYFIDFDVYSHLGGVVAFVCFTLLMLFLNINENSNVKKESEIRFYFNDLLNAFASMFAKNKHIKILRIFASSTATIQPKFFEEPDLKIDECVLLLRKAAGAEQTFSATSDLLNSAMINRWKAMVSDGKIRKLVIVPYQRESDLWYVICDDSCILTDLFIFDNKKYTPYAIHKNRGLIFVSSTTDNGKRYIKRYIDQFDSYVNCYTELNGVLLEEHYNPERT
jgi:hypothetical protein